uniref:Uncharacterized protein n=1 Tax=Trypanosoma vivax (strain Y486) TaxID=1055687 RepID=G0U120_TRYVY|nr:hypothetical protein TVY486_0803830 [Trypanosoma vivax Y486]
MVYVTNRSTVEAKIKAMLPCGYLLFFPFHHYRPSFPPFLAATAAVSIARLICLHYTTATAIVSAPSFYVFLLLFESGRELHCRTAHLLLCTCSNIRTHRREQGRKEGSENILVFYSPVSVCRPSHRCIYAHPCSF